MNRNVVATYTGDNSFKFFVEKVEIEKSQQQTEGKMIITGVASTTTVDHDSERMSLPALERMANIINEKSVPLRVEHRKDEGSIIGRVFEATIDAAKKLIIKAELDANNPTATMLWSSLDSGAKMGFSVGGRVKSAIREVAENVGKVVKTFYDVILDEVSITPRPANFDAWLTQHAFAKSENDSFLYRNTPLYDTFLFENPQLDYMAAIEKSIPSNAWVKVDSKNDKNMKIVKTSTTSETPEMKMDTASDSSTQDGEEMKDMPETSSDKEESKLASVSYVNKKFGEVVSLLKEIRKTLDTSSDEDAEKDGEFAENGSNDATREHGTTTMAESTPAFDQENPGSAKTRRKSVEVNQPGAERNRGSVTASDETPAMDQEMPTESKSRSKAKKASPDRAMYSDSVAADELDQQGGKQDASYSDSSAADKLDQQGPMKDMSDDSDSDGDEDESKTKSENKYGNEYLMPELQRAMKTARFSKTSPLDAFVYLVTKQVDDLKDALQKSNKRVLGLESRIAEIIRTSEPIQKTMKEWMRQPGPKRSVSLGVPYMVTRDGGRYELMAREVNIEKSAANLPKDFKSAYKSQFSSTANGEEIR